MRPLAVLVLATAACSAETAPPAPTPSVETPVDVNEADPDGRTSLMMAAFEGHTDVVLFLLDRGATLDQRDAMGRTALMYAASGPFPETVALLLERGAGADLADTHEGWTALMFAAGEGLDSVVDQLLLHGADPNIVDADGDTASDHARLRGHPELATLLEP